MNFLEGFDNVDWDFILSVLCKFRYRSKWIHIIPLAYANIQSKSKVNDVLPLPRILSELSMLLYIIKDEVLAISINVDTRTKGTHIADHEIKIVHFADDTTILLRDFSYFTKTEVKF